MKARVAEVRVKPALTRSRLFDYCVNPYAGCTNACVYCYARFATRFSHPGERWGSFVDVRTNVASMLQRDLARSHPGTVYMSSVCDPWQSSEERYSISHQCLALLLESGYPLFLQTKSVLARRDFDLLAGRTGVQFGVTVTSVDRDVARVFEPGASAPERRLRMVEEARGIGLRTFVFLGPLLPAVSDRGDGLSRLMDAVAEVEPNLLLIDRLNRRAGMWPDLMAAVSQVDQSLLTEYRRVLFSSDSALYTEEIRDRVTRAADARGLLDRVEWCFDERAISPVDNVLRCWGGV